MGLLKAQSLLELEPLNSKLLSCKRQNAWQTALNLVCLACQDTQLGGVSWHVAAAACLRRSWADALHLTEHGTQDAASVNIAIAATGQARNWLSSLAFLDAIYMRSLQADIVSYNSAGGSVEWEKALWLTGKGRKGACRSSLDAVGLNSVLTPASRTTNWKMVMFLLCWAPRMRVGVNIQCLTGALSVCERESFWQLAGDLMGFATGQRDLMSFDRKSMSSMIGSSGKAFRWQLALSFHSDVSRKGILPDAILFSTAINACSDGTDCWNAALGILRDLQVSGIVRSTSDSMVSAYQLTMSSCRARWQLPLCLLQTMSTARASKSGKLGDEACVNAVVNACVDNWQKAVELSTRCAQVNLIGLNSAISACSAPPAHWEVAFELQHLQARIRMQIETGQF